METGLILAAGMGRRLGHDIPKALIAWGDGAIIDHQLANLEAVGITDVVVVVGFQADRVRQHIAKRWPGARPVENPRYMDTQTSKSMLAGLAAIPSGDVVTLNGDVVFDADIVALLRDAPGSSLAVVPGVCGDEEIKYRVRGGRLVALGKQVHGDGEAVGINRFTAADRPLLEQALAHVEDGSYFERAIDHMAPYTSPPIACVSVGDRRAMEIDFPEDLERAQALFGQ